MPSSFRAEFTVVGFLPAAVAGRALLKGVLFSGWRCSPSCWPISVRLDVSFQLPQRAFILAVFLLLALAGLRRFVWPAVNSRETVIDRALAVERRRGIDSDLVAALQFESAAAETWGSPQLQAAVVERGRRIRRRSFCDEDPSDHVLRPQGNSPGGGRGDRLVRPLHFSPLRWRHSSIVFCWARRAIPRRPQSPASSSTARKRFPKFRREA